MIDGQELDVNTKEERNSYICPEKGCDLIPEVLSAHSDTGKIVFRCSKGHLNELNVEKYFQILDEKKDIIPKGEGYNIKKQNDPNSFRPILLEKIKSLSNIILVYLHIYKVQEQYPKNFYHIQNLINSRNSIIKERSYSNINSADPKITSNLDDIIDENITGEEAKKEEFDALDKLEKDYKIYLKAHYSDKNLAIKLKGSADYTLLEDKGFRLISQIRFRNLIELNLANNEIINITPLNDMLLPHLEIINFSDNKIEEISPIANLLSKSLSEIYIQNNKIKSLGPFLNSNFRFLEIFRVDGNPDAIKDISFEAICQSNKYRATIFYEIKSWNNFIKKYESNNLRQYMKGEELTKEEYPNVDKLELGSNRKAEILRDLFPLINYPNNIKNLILDDNKLHDVSYLTRMPLYKLEMLDLSLNLITNIKFMKKIFERCKKLKTLYLNDNKINDISPLTKNNENNSLELAGGLEALTLKNNYLNLNDKNTFSILDALVKISNDKNKKSTFALDYEDKDLQNYRTNSIQENEGSDEIRAPILAPVLAPIIQ